MYTVSARAHFDAAHFLAGYPGKCANLHGHRWTVVAEVRSETLNAGSMVIDFKDLKAPMQALADEWAHALLMEEGTLKPATRTALNEEGFRIVMLPCRPTAENLARLFFERLQGAGVSVSRVKVYETPDTYAAYEA